MPPRTPLDRGRVIQAAVAVADERGVAAVSMRNVAQHLGVEAMSLYHHVDGKDAILRRIVDAVFEEIELPEAGLEWRTWTRRRASSARAAISRHSWALGLMESRRDAGPATLRHHDATLGCLLTAGFSVTDAVHAASVVDSYVYGFALQEQQLPFRTPEQMTGAAGELLDRIDDDLPHLRTVAAVRTAGGPTLDDEFTFGLDLILDALDRHRGSPPGAAGSPPAV